MNKSILEDLQAFHAELKKSDIAPEKKVLHLLSLEKIMDNVKNDSYSY